jgi:glycosyltransferase involved in cell wall biosynthesis
MEKQPIRFSVIIPTYKNWGAISRVLPSVLAQANETGDVEVIVVDSSDDGSGERLRAVFPRIKLLHSAQRLLPGPARNLGASSTAGEILIFLDGDCRPGDGWFAGFRAAQRELESGIVCGAVDLDEPCDLSQFMEYVMWKLPESSAIPRGRYGFVITENMMIRKEDFFKTVGFGESDSANDAEMDVARRRAGLVVTFEPLARVFHIHSRGWRLHFQKLHRIGYEAVELMLSLEDYRIGRWMRWLFPVVFLVRWVRVSYRVVRYRPEWLARYLLIQPMVWIGLVAHQLGLWRGLIRACSKH